MGGTYPSGNGYWINDDGSYRDGDGYRIYDDVVLTEEATLVSLQYLMRLYDVNEFEFLITTNTNGRPGETISKIKKYYLLKTILLLSMNPIQK